MKDYEKYIQKDISFVEWLGSFDEAMFDWDIPRMVGLLLSFSDNDSILKGDLDEMPNALEIRGIIRLTLHEVMSSMSIASVFNQSALESLALILWRSHVGIVTEEE